jgi:hypothetical protein
VPIILAVNLATLLELVESKELVVLGIRLSLKVVAAIFTTYHFESFESN